MASSSSRARTPCTAPSRTIPEGVRIVLQRRTLATFVNEVVRAGLQLEQLVEGEVDTSLATDDHADPARWYSIARARLMPTTFIVKARKPG
jgi:hypothetical protein